MLINSSLGAFSSSAGLPVMKRFGGTSAPEGPHWKMGKEHAMDWGDGSRKGDTAPTKFGQIGLQNIFRD